MSAFDYYTKKLGEKIILRLKEIVFENWAMSHVLRRISEDPKAKLHWSRAAGEPLTIQPTITNGTYPPREFRVGVYEIGSLEVYSKERVHLLGFHSTPVDEDGNLLAYAVLPESYQHFLLHADFATLLRAATQWWPTGPRVIDQGVLLVNAWSQSYFHWFVEILPRILFLQNQIQSNCHLIVENNPKKWQKRSLELLGFSKQQVLCYSQPLFVEKMWIPPHVHQRVANIGIFVPLMLQTLREQMICSSFAKNCSQNLSPKVYISRSKANGRRIANEDELVQSLADRGFAMYCLEDMSLDEQIALFSQAKLIVAPHGAGLTNMLWARNATILELFGAYWNPSFLTLANALHHRYFCYSSKLSSKERRQRLRIQKRSNFEIDIDDFSNFLDKQCLCCTDLSEP